MTDHDMTLLWHYVNHWAICKPDAEALVFGDQRLTWRAFNEQVDLTAKAFLEIGVEKGDCVAMIAMGRPEFMISFMAAAKIGAIWLGLSPKFTVEELRSLVSHCQPTVLITLREYAGIDLVARGITFRAEFPRLQQVLLISEAFEDVPAFAEFISRPRPERDAELAQRAGEVTEEDEALLMYTSGSTGKPKGVLHTHQTIMASAAVEADNVALDGNTRTLMHFPINHVAADVELGYTTVYTGGTLVFMDHFSPRASIELIQKERITVLGQVPAMYLLQFQHPLFPGADWSSVRTFIWGGSPAPRIVLDTLAAIAAKTGARLATGYGSTELGGFVTYSRPGDSIDLLAGSAGCIVPPYELKLVDDARNEVPVGQTGEIAFRGPTLMSGYLNDPANTSAVIDAEGWYYTNDLGRLDKDGNLFICGRATEMFKSGGENVFPREVEEIIESHPAVFFAAVVGVPDPLYDEVGQAFVMVKPGQAVEADELHAYCKARLVNFKVPKTFVLRPQLPLLSNGKVNRMALREELGLPPKR